MLEGGWGVEAQCVQTDKNKAGINIYVEMSSGWISKS